MLKIQLVTDQPSGPLRARVPVEACPLCRGTEFAEVRQVDAAGDSLLPPDLESQWAWLGCEGCGHIFTGGTLDAQGFEALHSLPLTGRMLEPARSLSRHAGAALVHRISVLRGTASGAWLDAGCGAGSLLSTAHEFGYEAVGIDQRRSAVELLRAENYTAEIASIEDIEGVDLFDVISFFDSFDGQIDPARTLQAVGRLMRPGGVLSICLPNVDSRAWRELDEAGINPYWNDPARFHNFSREHLYWLLRRNGFEPCDFTLSADLPAGMEVCATFASEIN